MQHAVRGLRQLFLKDGLQAPGRAVVQADDALARPVVDVRADAVGIESLLEVLTMSLMPP